MKKMQAGVYIQTREEMISDQKNWDDNDPCKKQPFSGYAFWVVTDDGVTPEGFDTEEEAQEYISN